MSIRFYTQLKTDLPKSAALTGEPQKDGEPLKEIEIEFSGENSFKSISMNSLGLKN